MRSLTSHSKTILHGLAVTLLPFAAPAQTVGWVQVGSPSARADMALAYDGATQSALLYGGINGSAILGELGFGAGRGSRCPPLLRLPRAWDLEWPSMRRPGM